MTVLPSTACTDSVSVEFTERAAGGRHTVGVERQVYGVICEQRWLYYTAIVAK